MPVLIGRCSECAFYRATDKGIFCTYDKVMQLTDALLRPPANCPLRTNTDPIEYWSAGGRKYSLSRSLEWARECFKVEWIPIGTLLSVVEKTIPEEFVGSEEFVDRAHRADLRVPILVISDGDDLLVADGVHRVWKAKMLGKQRVRGYIVPYSDVKRWCP